MTFTYNPKGVCSRQFTIEVEEGKVVDISIVGGCSGNLQGIGALVKGMSAQEAIDRLKGIRCGMRSTSCPDQLARGLEAILAEMNK